MQQNKENALLLKYLENNCSAEELQEVAHYLANAEYPDSLDELLEEEWKSFKAPDHNNEQLAQQIRNKFNKKIKP